MRRRDSRRRDAAIAGAGAGGAAGGARRLLVDVPIVIAELPAEADVEAGSIRGCSGSSAGRRTATGHELGGQPGLTQIVLFRRNLERAAASEEELREEIRTTLLHETGHFFGMDEAELEGVGLD